MLVITKNILYIKNNYLIDLVKKQSNKNVRKELYLENLLMTMLMNIL